MPIKTACNACGTTLEIADEHAGQQVRCPVCGQMVTAAEKPAQETMVSQARWHLKTPEGWVFGPVAKATLDQWVAEGRVADDCHVREGDAGAWTGAAEVYSELKQVASSPAPVRPVVRPQTAPVAAHRGGLILLLGILGFFTCPVFSVMAWTMGAADLEEMRQGRMDPSGRGTTHAGLVLGMIVAIGWIIISVAAFFWMLFFIAA